MAPAKTLKAGIVRGKERRAVCPGQVNPEESNAEDEFGKGPDHRGLPKPQYEAYRV